ncbi:MAG: hypothetical protein AAFR66_10375 [Bacteroidota bacterium]
MLKRLPTINLRWFFWGVVFLLHLVFFFIQQDQQGYYLPDSYEYAKEAYNLIDHGVLYCGELDDSINFDFFTKRAPVYPVLLAFCVQLFGNELAVIGFQIILSLLNILLVIQLLKLLGISYRYRLTFFFLLLYPAQFMFVNWVMAEILFQSCLLLMLTSVIKWQKTENQSWLWTYLLAFVLGIFTKPILYLFIFPSAAGLLYLGWPRLRLALIGSVVVPFFLVGGFMQWNYMRTGFFHFSSIQNLTLLHHTTYRTLMSSQGPEKAEDIMSFIQLTAAQKQSYGEEQVYIQKRILAEIGNAPITYAFLHMEGMLRFLLDPGPQDILTFLGLEEQTEGKWGSEENGGFWESVKGLSPYSFLLLLLILMGNVLKMIGIGLFLRTPKVSNMLKWMLIGIPLYIVMMTGVIGNARFAVGVFPILMLCAIIGWSSVYAKWRNAFRLGEK